MHKFKKGMHRIVIIGADDKVNGPINMQFTRISTVTGVRKWDKLALKTGTEFADDLKQRYINAPNPKTTWGYCVH
jgi:hypothetical protein